LFKHVTNVFTALSVRKRLSEASMGLLRPMEHQHRRKAELAGPSGFLSTAATATFNVYVTIFEFIYI
jgi:hypothetical protein